MPRSWERYRRSHETITGQIGVDVRIGQPYPAYRDSGVEWLGQVPAHWAVVPLKRVAWFCSGAGFPVSAQGNVDGEVLFAKVSDMNRSGNHRQIVSAANSVTREVACELRAYVFPPGTIVFPKVGGALLTNKRRILVRETCIDNNLMGCVVTGAATEFAFRVLQWLDLGGMAKPGPVPAIGEGEVREIRVQLPPWSEQTAIARFLDHADRHIWRYIRAKERLIELLEEQKQAIIRQAVTGQIDVRTGRPYPAYKDSGMEWLGDVPEHWEVWRLHRCVRATGGMTPSMQSPSYWDGGIPWVTPKDMKMDAIGDSEMTVTEAALDDTSLRIVDSGAVLIVVRGMILAKCVPVAWTTDPVTINQDMKALVPVRGVGGEFLARALRSGQEALLSCVEVAGHGTRRLPTERWRSLHVAIPSTNEQQRIAAFVAKLTQLADSAIEAATRLVELVHEYRTRLIADVVTGKLDVREAGASLPEIDRFDAENTLWEPASRPLVDLQSPDSAP